MDALKKHASTMMAFCFIFLSLSFQVSAKDPEWLRTLKRVRPLRSNQFDIENLLGQKGKKYEGQADWYYYLVEYETTEGEWNVQYSTGKCSSEKKEGFDVESGVVLDVSLILEEPVDFASLKLDLRRFEKTPESDTSNVFFTSYRSGIEYVRGRGNLLHSVRLFPAEKYKSLHCGR